jgi:hypothetical protein
VNIMLPLVNRNWEGDLRTNKSVWVRTLGSIAMASYTRGTTISYQDLTPTKEQFVVNDGQYFAFEVDDLDEAQNDISALDSYMRRAVVSLNNVIETKLLSTYTSVPSANRITGASAAAITLDNTTSPTTGIYQLFLKARALLAKQNVPATPGARWAIVDPDTMTLLLSDTDHFVRAGELGDKIVQFGRIGGEDVARTASQAPGFQGMIAGFMVYETPHVVTTGGAKYLLFGDNEAISYASQITKMETLRLQTTFATAARGLLLHDVFIPAENAKRLVYIKATP